MAEYVVTILSAVIALFASLTLVWVTGLIVHRLIDRWHHAGRSAALRIEITELLGVRKR